MNRLNYYEYLVYFPKIKMLGIELPSINNYRRAVNKF